ncbi:MAG: hypothetical protein HY806_06175 [Nitrospirae bacterium]|nr:hypothetical protein [Nitrospirota bacterium]
MNTAPKFISFTLLSCAGFFLFFLSPPAISVTQAEDEKLNTAEYHSIAELIKDVQQFKEKLIAIRGQYLGWRGGDIPHPGITRSDWIIKDKTGAIYVTGKTSAGLSEKDIGVEIIVKGKLLLSKDLIPYIQALEVIKTATSK